MTLLAIHSMIFIRDCKSFVHQSRISSGGESGVSKSTPTWTGGFLEGNCSDKGGISDARKDF